MSKRAKVIFLSLSIFGSFFLYCVYYYSNMVKNAPYRSFELESIVFKYGTGTDLENQFDSKTGVFQYVNNNDSLVSTNVKLNKNDFIYIHHKAAALGFWNFPDDMTETAEPQPIEKSTRYYLEFNYKEKTKKMLLDVAYSGNPKLHDAAKSLIEEVQRLISDAEDRQAK